MIERDPECLCAAERPRLVGRPFQNLCDNVTASELRYVLDRLPTNGFDLPDVTGSSPALLQRLFREAAAAEAAGTL